MTTTYGSLRKLRSAAFSPLAECIRTTSWPLLSLLLLSPLPPEPGVAPRKLETGERAAEGAIGDITLPLAVRRWLAHADVGSCAWFGGEREPEPGGEPYRPGGELPCPPNGAHSTEKQRMIPFAVSSSKLREQTIN